MHKQAQIIAKHIFITLLLSLIHLVVRAQTGQWYTSDGDLSSSLINNVMYDSRGMLWITTEECLNRFDGSKFTIYHHDPNNPHSIGSDHVNNTFEDADGRVYVCSHAGVQIYDPATDSFSEPLKVRDDRDGDSASTPLSCVLQRKSGELWAVGNKIYRILGDSNDAYLELADLPESIQFIFNGAVDANDNLWLPKHSEGLYRIDPSGKIKHYFGRTDDPVMTSFGTDVQGTLYVGSAKHGLFKYTPDTDTFESIDLGADYEGHTIATICPDSFGNLLIGTDGGGMFVYKTDNGRSRQFDINNIDYDKLKIHGITHDSYGNLWIGVYQKGLLKLPKLTAFFKSIDQRNTNLIGSCCVTSIVRDSDGTLWVGTDNDDVYAVDLATRTSKHYTIDIPASVMGLYIDSEGRLWVGSYNRGMGIIDRYTGKYTPVKIYKNGIDVSHVYDFAELPNGDILIATMGAGLFRYSDATKSAEPLELDNLGEWVTTVDVSPDTGEIYVGTYDGLFIYSPDFKQDKWLLRHHIVSSIHAEHKYGDIWVGTNAGLARINKQRELERIYTMADGLPSSSVHAIEHGDDALWISTNHGLSKFNVKKGTFTNFVVEHGLPNNEFSRNSSFKDEYGNIYFGGINGIATLNASDINMTGEKLTLRVTDFFIGDTSVNSNTRSGSRQVIDCPIADARIFRLSHNDNTFSIRVNTMEFVNTNQTEFYYSFDGSDWTRINSNNSMSGVTLTFTNVPSGMHTLKIKVINAGIESDELTLKIDISTIWYATWWAKIIYMLIFLGLCYILFMHIKRRIEHKRKDEERRHKDEILEAKLQFFTNISHEIRTPLSLVIGPMQKLQDTDTDRERNKAYNVVVRNANRILRLVNELMDLRKIDNNQMKLRFTQVNLCTFVNDLYETFTAAAAAKHIKFTYEHVGCDDMYAWVDHTNFDKIIMNLLSNAVKFTPEHGTIDICLSRGHDDNATGPLRDYAEISVTDTGIGISEDDRKNIFNRFFQGRNNHVGGTGIGLHLTHELVKLHHGSIEICDNPAGVGSRFVVRIPLGNDHLNAEEICTDQTMESYPNGGNEHNIHTLDIVDNANDLTKSCKSVPKNNELVYIVEDDEEIRNYLIANFSKYYHVCGFSNGKLALDAIHDRQPSLVITDVMMPEMDGYALTKKIKQNINLNQIPVIILTAKTREEDNIEAIDSGAAIYVSKPFNIDILIKTAQNLINSVARLRNAFSGNQTQEDKLEEIEVASNDDKLMDRVMKVINKNLSNSDITVEMIAREIGISRVHLHRKLKELTNQSTRDFIRNIRLQTAAKLLREKKLTVSEVSDLVGFKQANNFSTVFKEMFGMSPTAYAAKYHDTGER